MKRFRNSQEQGSVVSIPQDLITEILARLPPSSIGKLIVVSKLWSNTIRSKYFTDLYLARSLTRPCVLFTFHSYHKQFFHSVSEELLTSSSSTTTTRLPPNPLHDVSPPIRGLICCQDSSNSKFVILNPSTGQVVDLPKVKTRRRRISSFLGYDSIKDEYKVLSMTVVQRAYNYGPVVSEEHQVFTLGAQKKKEKTWRMIECKVPHCPVTKGLCNNGVVYYGAWSNTHIRGKGSLIVGFDVRLEEFSLVELPDGVEIKPDYNSELVKYQKNIALVNRAVSYKGKVELWVLEDVETQSWSKIVFMVPGWAALNGNYFFRCRGAISSGEFIFTTALSYPCPTFYIISYDSNEKIGRRVMIEGIGDRFDSMSVFLDHVESPLFL